MAGGGVVNNYRYSTKNISNSVAGDGTLLKSIKIRPQDFLPI